MLLLTRVDILGAMILFYKFLFMKELPLSYTLYADLPGHLASISPLSTIPPSISSTSSRPDIVLVSDDHVILLELSVVTGFTASLVIIEVGCLGHFLPTSVCKVCHLQKNCV